MAAPKAESAENIRTIKIVGSSTLRPLMLEIAGDYAKTHNVRIPVDDKGTAEGLSCVKAKTCDLGIVSKTVEVDDSTQMRVHHVAWDGIAIVAHRDFPFDSLTTEQVKNIFSGQIKNAKELAGPDKALHVYIRESGRASTAILESQLKIKVHGESFGSNDGVQNRLFNIPNSIAYYSLGLAREAGSKAMKVLKIDGIEPTKETIASGKYVLVRELAVVQPILDKPNPDVDEFLQYLKANSGPQIRKHGFMP